MVDGSPLVEKKESEPFLTYVMPISQLGCWLALFMVLKASMDDVVNLHHDWVLGACGFYWAWAFKNRIAGPLWTDMAVFSMFPGVAAAVFEKVQGGQPTKGSTIGCMIGCLLPLLNYLKAMSLPLFKGDPAVIASTLKKSEFWAKVFVNYCYSNIGFWGVSVAVLVLQIVKGWDTL